MEDDEQLTGIACARAEDDEAVEREQTLPAGIPRPATMRRQQQFLAEFAKTGVVTTAAEAIGICRQTHYEWLKKTELYPNYKTQFEDACERAADVCEQAMFERGVNGYLEPVFGSLAQFELVEVGEGETREVVRKYTGIVGYKRVHSDRMLELALKARRPSKFRERVDMQHSGADGGPIETVTKIERVIVKPKIDGQNT